MIQIAVCDNDNPTLQDTYKKLQEYKQLHPDFSFYIRRFQSSRDLLGCVKSRRMFDVYFLDVPMTDIDGITLGRTIRELQKDALIIYLTASPEYAAEAFKIRAFHYLIKPPARETLFALLDQLAEQLSCQNTHLLPVRTKGGITSINISRIRYVECMNHTFYYHLLNDATVVSTVMRTPFDLTVRPLLGTRFFVKIGASFAVNLFYVQKLLKRSVILTDGSSLPVSRRLYPCVKDTLLEFLPHADEEELACVFPPSETP